MYTLLILSLRSLFQDTPGGKKQKSVMTVNAVETNLLK